MRNKISMVLALVFVLSIACFASAKNTGNLRPAAVRAERREDRHDRRRRHHRRKHWKRHEEKREERH